MRKKNRNKKAREEREDIDLTPMLDVVFIMLIFFVVTASFLREQSLPIHQPDLSPDEATSERQSLLLTLASDDEISIDNRQVDIRAVRSLVAQHIAENPQGGVVVRAHEQASANAYVELADQVRMVNRIDVTLLTFNED